MNSYLENIFENVNNLSKDTTIIYRLWTMNNNKLDEKSTEIVNKIKNYYHLDKETIDKIYLSNNIKISDRIYIDKDNEFEWPEISNYKSEGYCYALKTQIAILVDGTVVPCCLDSNGCVELSNIFKEDLDQIINSKKYQELKKSFQDRKPIEELCKSCKFKEKLN